MVSKITVCNESLTCWLNATVDKTGRQSAATKPEDLPVAVNNIHAFGGKAEKRMPRTSLSLSIFSIAVTKKFKPMRKFFAVTALFISSQLTAQTDSSRTLNPVVVTASKFPQKQSSTGKVVSVITKEQIEKSSGRTIAQLLNEQAGLTINGALNVLGSNQTVSMRGSSAGRTLILLDGIPVNDPTLINNEFDLNLISLNNVERIEVCRGAQSN